MNRREFLGRAAATAACGAAFPSFSAIESPLKPDYTLRIQPVSVELAKDTLIHTIGYNGTAPGPLLRLERGKKANIQVFNETDTPELVHWHGLHIDSLNDGAMEEGSPMIAPHGQQLYSFTPEPDGCRWYHTHTSAAANLKVATYTGQYGFLYIEPKQNSGSYDQEIFLAVHHWEPMMMPMGPPINSLEVGYKYASFNDKLHSAAEPLRVKQGQRVLFHFLNASATQDVSLALPGHTFKIVALDGNPVPNPQTVTTVSLSVAERVDAIVEMNQPGVWVLGSTNDAEQKKGLGLTIEYAGSKGAPQWKDPGKSDWSYTLFGRAPTPGFPAKRFPMVFEKQTGAAAGGLDLWTINGKGFPDIPALEVQQGKRYRLSFVNTTGEPHPVHLHRHSFELANVAGKPTGGIFKDTVSVDAYSKVDVDFIANNPGPTLFHCHQQLHMDYGFMQMIHYV